jgi:hypothetical protein
VYLSPQSVSSRIKSINEEIKNNINRNREEMKCNKIKDEEEEEVRSIKSQGSISVDNRISIGNKIEYVGKGIGKDVVKDDQKEAIIDDQREDQSKVRDLVKNYSMRLNQQEDGNRAKDPFTQRQNNKSPFITKGNPLTNSPFNRNNLSNNPFGKDPIPKKDNPFNKNLHSTSNNNPLSNNPFSNTNNPLSVLSLNEHSFPLRPFPSLSLSPINVIYAPKNPPTLEKKVGPSSPKKSFNKTLTSSFSFYGPGIEITEDITFSILNTIYKFENGIEDTIYYIRIQENNNFNPISWIIKKSLSQIRDFLKKSSFKKDLDLSFNPYDKKIRDNMIITILNTLGERNKGDHNEVNINENLNDHYNLLQFFILTNITKDLDKRSNYLLMSNPPSPILEPFNFRLVGQALVCYDKTNRVKKIFLLKGCKVEIHSEYSFKISSLESNSSLENNVILYSSCTVERDSWIKDIEEFIK